MLDSKQPAVETCFTWFKWYLLLVFIYGEGLSLFDLNRVILSQPKPVTCSCMQADCHAFTYLTSCMACMQLVL